ncbi:hypothetical protein O4H49_14175 [Kiloniella laminariae]|uniref:Uncharacterized protein n=1 Tax=Kiloniella laminariae TaxID=454162 RepID=A0ABT4LLD5_9PROT|nr:hypothetical protein [Kiloniella laminariae]MCZ4281934.1 hypothetical protein [Kiloniella laminariae]
MSLGLRETRRRRSQTFRWTLLKWLIALIMIGAAGWYSYLIGNDLANKEVSKLQNKNRELDQTVQELMGLRDQLNLELEETKQVSAELESRYQNDVPTGEIKILVNEINNKLENGVSLDRIKFLISTAAKTQSCDNDPIEKRFFVNTPFYTGAHDNIDYARGSVTITAQGESAYSSDGKVEAWYDPAKPIDVIFTLLGGEQVKVSGELPLHKSVVVNGSEYRFTLKAGARGFMQAIGDRCDYP